MGMTSEVFLVEFPEQHVIVAGQVVRGCLHFGSGHAGGGGGGGVFPP